MVTLECEKLGIVCVESCSCNLMANDHDAKSWPKRGIRREKSGRHAARIRDPIRRKEVWLGTFDTVEEASQAYLSRKSEFEKLVKVNQGKQPIVSAESSKEASDLTGGVRGAKQTDGCVVTSHPKAKRSLPGIRRQKNGWYDVAGRDPIRHKKVWLGNDAVKEGSKDYFSKKSEFEELSKENMENKPKNCDQIQPESPAGASSSVDNDQTLVAASLGRNKTINSHETTHYVGVRKTPSGRYWSRIRNPFTKKEFSLGTFDTAKEASQAYQSKKLEFQKLVKAKQQCNRQTHSSAGKKKQGRKVELVNIKQGHESVIIEGFQPESASGASSSEIEDPMSNPSNRGSDQRSDSPEISHSMGVQKRESGKCTTGILLGALGADEEAFRDDQCEKFDFQRSKKVELQSNIPTDSSAGENQEDEDLWMGQWVQLPGDIKEVKFSLKLGLPIIDNYGSLLGEFSSLDDLSIC